MALDCDISVFAIADLHMPGGDWKPMDVFGQHWENHIDKIAEDWAARVRPEDIVLIPGDISWAMQLEDALADLELIAAWPGKKILLRGNHDYWWSSLTRIRAALPDDMHVLQNDCVEISGEVFCGTRGWISPNDTSFTAQDEKIYRREAGRLELSLNDAKRKYPDKTPVAMMHYPPFSDEEDTLFTQLFEQHQIERVVYGHLHGQATTRAFNGSRGGVQYNLVSCDALDFKLMQIK